MSPGTPIFKNNKKHSKSAPLDASIADQTTGGLSSVDAVPYELVASMYLQMVK